MSHGKVKGPGSINYHGSGTTGESENIEGEHNEKINTPLKCLKKKLEKLDKYYQENLHRKNIILTTGIICCLDDLDCSNSPKYFGNLQTRRDPAVHMIFLMPLFKNNSKYFV